MISLKKYYLELYKALFISNILLVPFFYYKILEIGIPAAIIKIIMTLILVIIPAISTRINISFLYYTLLEVLLFMIMML
jgi:hypothetical protein